MVILHPSMQGEGIIEHIYGKYHHGWSHVFDPRGLTSKYGNIQCLINLKISMGGRI
jgi:hypothetical protein